MTSDKRSMRDEARLARSRAAEAGGDAASLAAAATALCVPEVVRARTVLAYAATPEELDPSPLVIVLRECGARIAYPRVCAPGLLSLHWADDAELTPGYCGVREPDAEAEAATLEEIDLVLVPGVAFDAACCRLGMGGGFYDRLLREVRVDATTLGLAFDEQVVDGVPVEAHDVTVDLVVTPTRTLRRDRS